MAENKPNKEKVDVSNNKVKEETVKPAEENKVENVKPNKSTPVVVAPAERGFFVTCLVLSILTFVGASSLFANNIVNPSDGSGSDTPATEETYSVFWLNDDGSYLEVDHNVKNGEMPKYDGAEPTKANSGLTKYSFNGWNTPLKPVTSDAIYFATYSVSYDNAKVVFDLNGHGDSIPSQEVTYGGHLTKPTDPTTTGFLFDGWFKDASCSFAWDFESDVVTSNITLYAKWTVCYKIEFDAGESASTFEPQYVRHGGHIVFPGTPEGYVDGGGTPYTFDDWEFYGYPWDFENNVVLCDLTLVANYSGVK